MRKIVKRLLADIIDQLTDTQLRSMIDTAVTSLSVASVASITSSIEPGPETYLIDDVIKKVEEEVNAGDHPLNIIGRLVKEEPEESKEAQIERKVLTSFLETKGLKNIDHEISLNDLRAIAKGLGEAKPVAAKPDISKLPPPIAKKGKATQDDVMEAVHKLAGPNLSDKDREWIGEWLGKYTLDQINDSLKGSIAQGAYSLRHTNGVLKKFDVIEAEAGTRGGQVGRWKFE